MTVTMLKGKIHRAVVKQAELNYVGSITVDPELMEAAGITPLPSLAPPSKQTRYKYGRT